MLKSLLPTFTVYFAFVLLTTKDRRTTLPSLPGQRDTEERGYINASHHGGSSCSVTGSDGIFFHCHPRVVRIFSRDCRITLQLNSPMPVLPTMQSDDVRQENMATVNTAEILLEMLQKKASYPLKNCRTPGFYGSFISCIETLLMTTSDTFQCPELI